MMTFPKGGFTDFENAVIRLRVLNTRLKLALTLFESPESNIDMIGYLIYELSDEYNAVQENFHSVFYALESVDVTKLLLDFLKKNSRSDETVVEAIN